MEMDANGKACLLVVDDEPDMCWALGNILRPAGYEVTTAAGGVEATGLVALNRYAAAFVDAKLLDIDGLELAAWIREHSPDTAVVLVSGYFYPEDKIIVDGLQRGLFVGFIAKPFDLYEVRRMACQAVNRGLTQGKNDAAGSDHR
jgi:DNA-binding NtrC family response regulator